MTVADIAKNTEHRLKQNEILQIAKELNILPLPHKEKTSFWQAVKFSSSQAGFNPDFMFKNNANQFLVIEISCSPNSPKLMKEMICCRIIANSSNSNQTGSVKLIIMANTGNKNYLDRWLSFIISRIPEIHWPEICILDYSIDSFKSIIENEFRKFRQIA